MTSPSPRGRFQGACQIMRYNAPFYVSGTLACLAGGLVMGLAPLPSTLRALGWCGLALAAWWLLGSLLVSWWVYDHSPLYKWDWLRDFMPDAPRRWANIHSGLDESTPALRDLWGGTWVVLDMYDEATMSEPSIRRARALTPPAITPTSIRFDALPLDSDSQDAVFLLFAAHELREAKNREALVREVCRVLREGGSVILVEHLRDAANFLAFGPGFFHFLPPGEWQRLARHGGFTIEAEQRMTPFVRVWRWRKKGEFANA